jgi:hypothetical protein
MFDDWWRNLIVILHVSLCLIMPEKDETPGPLQFVGFVSRVSPG